MSQVMTEILAAYIQQSPIVMAVVGTVIALFSVRLVAKAIRTTSSCWRDTAGVGSEIAYTLCAGTACMLALLSGGVAMLSAGIVIASLF